MRRERPLWWLADADATLWQGPNVFVPSIMGAGILVSLAIIVGDVVRRLRPGAGAARAAAVGRRAAELVAPVALTLGRPVPEAPRPRRRLRSRGFYLVLLMVSGLLGLYIAIGSTSNYLQPGAPFSGEEWMEALASLVSVGFLALATASFAISYRYPVIPAWVEVFVDRTPLGIPWDAAANVASVPKRGSPVTDFCLRDARNRIVCGRDVLGARAAILWFHHGQWCPRCRTGLEELNRELASLSDEDRPAVVAVSADAVHDTARLARDLEVGFPLLSDPENSLAREFGVGSTEGVRAAAFVLNDRGLVERVFLPHAGRDVPEGRAVVRAAISSRSRLPVTAPSDVLTPAVAALVVLVLTLLGALAIFSNRNLLFWDRPVRDAIQGFGDAGFATFINIATKLGSRWLIGALIAPAAVMAWRRCRQIALTLPALFVGALVAELVLKAAIDRPRPVGAAGFGSSFPSGHVIAATAFWGLLPPLVYLMTKRKWAWVAAVAAAGAIVAAVGISRVYLGAHWPSDVVGGYLSGALLLLVAEWAIRRPWRVLRCEGCDFHPLAGPDEP